MDGLMRCWICRTGVHQVIFDAVAKFLHEQSVLAALLCFFSIVTTHILSREDDETDRNDD